MDSARQLALVLHRYLTANRQDVPALHELQALIEAAYSVSLRTEEGQAISCELAWIDPRAADPAPPSLILPDRWTFVPLGAPIPLSVDALTKFARCSDSRASWIGVHRDPDEPGGLAIWGLVDQAHDFDAFRTLVAPCGHGTPGLFHLKIAGTGHLIIYDGYWRVAELRIDRLITRQHEYDALSRGAVFDLLRPAIQEHDTRVRARIPVFELGDDHISVLTWTKSLARILIGAQSFRHGGAFILTPRVRRTQLRVKYRLNYRRVRELIDEVACLEIESRQLAPALGASHNTSSVQVDPVRLGHVLQMYEYSRNALNGAIAFTSLLSRVDGAVVLTPDLEVHGYGAEITVARRPAAVYRAKDDTGTATLLETADYEHFGTRHRSAMRYCSVVPSSIAFVVSQDGDVRVITNVAGRVIFWDSIRLVVEELSEFPDRPSVIEV